MPPFPGMDPYLETPAVWPTARGQFLAALFQQLLPALADRYRLRLAAREYTAQTPLFTSVLVESFAEDYLEIHSRSTGQLVTVVDLVSLANRLTPAGRSAYLATRADVLGRRANLVELDLITQGEPPAEALRAEFPECDYLLSVTRHATTARVHGYPLSLEKRLPWFRLPLAPQDRDPAIDFQQTFDQARERGQWDRLVDYHAPPPAGLKLTESSEQFLNATLRAWRNNSSKTA